MGLLHLRWEVTSGQVFTFTNKGPVHLSCLRRTLAPRLYLSSTEAALLDLVYLANEGIVRVKDIEGLVNDEDVKKLIQDFRRTLEGFAAKLTNKLVERVGSQ